MLSLSTLEPFPLSILLLAAVLGKPRKINPKYTTNGSSSISFPPYIYIAKSGKLNGIAYNYNTYTVDIL